MTDGAIHFSTGFENILTGPLAPYEASGHVASPWELFNDDVRTEAVTDPIAWLRGVADGTKYANLLIPHERIAFLFDVRWATDEDGVKNVSEAHCQAVIVEGITIQDVLGGATPKQHQYLRADLEPKNLGAVFPEPVPHVHSNVKKTPRFPTSLSAAAPHVDFIELVIRNYDRPLWDTWASRVWESRIGAAAAVRDESGELVEDGLAHLKGAFEKNLLTLLLAPSGNGALRKVTELWKKTLIDEKVRMTPLRRDASYDVLSY